MFPYYKVVFVCLRVHRGLYIYIYRSQPLRRDFSILLGVYYGWLVIDFNGNQSPIDHAGYMYRPVLQSR